MYHGIVANKSTHACPGHRGVMQFNTYPQQAMGECSKPVKRAFNNNNVGKYLVFLFFVLNATLNAQDVNSAKKAFNAKQYSKVIKMAQGALKKDKTQATWYYLKACSEFQLSKNPKYADGKINYFKESLKDAVDARKYDKEGTELEEYSAYFDAIVTQNNKEALANYAKKSWVKAQQLYRMSYQLTGDTQAYGWLGLSYWGDRKFADALPILKEVTSWNYDAFVDGSGEGTYMREPFEVLSTFYLEKNYFDTAQRYTQMGLKIYPLNHVLLGNARKMLRNQLITLARSGSVNTVYRDVVKSGLNFFPADTFFLAQQNYYYLTKIMQSTQAKPYDSVDFFTTEFYNSKKELLQKGVKNATDEFLIADYNKFLFQCLDYFLRTATERTAPYFFRKWYALEYKYKEFDENLSEKLLQNPPDNVSHRLISMLFSDVMEDYPWNKKIKQYRLDYFNKWIKKPLSRGALEGMVEMNEALMKDFPADKTLKPSLQGLLVRIMDSCITHKEMYDAWKYYYRLKTDFAQVNLDDAQKRLAMADFEVRYSGSRIYSSTVSGKKVAHTGWDGKSSECQVGDMPDSTLYSVINRLNYYRQNAGVVLPMDLSREKAHKCQEAAVMFAPKGIFTREPSEATHTCYTKGAAEAAAIGQCVLENNPALCVTIFMDDNKSDELVNRRAILNPAALEAGFGSAENCSVFWMLDLGDTPDSNYYKTHFVAWPPPGYAPKMLTFKKWSFSMAADLKDAIVTIKNKAGEPIDFGFGEYPVPGMFLHTIVISTQLNPKALNAGDYFDVMVELKDKRKFSYRVTLF